MTSYASAAIILCRKRIFTFLWGGEGGGDGSVCLIYNFLGFPMLKIGCWAGKSFIWIYSCVNIRLKMFAFLLSKSEVCLKNMVGAGKCLEVGNRRVLQKNIHHKVII